MIIRPSPKLCPNFCSVLHVANVSRKRNCLHLDFFFVKQKDLPGKWGLKKYWRYLQHNISHTFLVSMPHWSIHTIIQYLQLVITNSTYYMNITWTTNHHHQANNHHPQIRGVSVTSTSTHWLVITGGPFPARHQPDHVGCNLLYKHWPHSIASKAIRRCATPQTLKDQARRGWMNFLQYQSIFTEDESFRLIWISNPIWVIELEFPKDRWLAINEISSNLSLAILGVQ